ncbi:HepT-like ribonuclease domain-containing protein [Methanoculleus sp.]|uniref:HepT-like ribonuclease domain-containing protein n=1 Tax=Methanoculleus sp. TaxID=90427 RepID=UPI0025CFFDB3|nr:HepT-like ribonuclease domain-containing protein [Methanoculleus sp.]
MSREYDLYLRDILEAIGRIERYTRGMEYEEFLANELVQDGIIRNLMIIGEAVKLIPDR